MFSLFQKQQQIGQFFFLNKHLWLLSCGLWKTHLLQQRNNFAHFSLVPTFLRQTAGPARGMEQPKESETPAIQDEGQQTPSVIPSKSSENIFVLNNNKKYLEDVTSMAQLHYKEHGHTHLPLAFLQEKYPHLKQETLPYLEKFLQEEGQKLIFNPVKAANLPFSFWHFLKVNFSCSWVIDKKRVKLRRFTRDDIIVLCLLSSALLLTTPARTHMNSLAAAMIATDTPLQYSISKHGQLLYVGAIAAATGRICTGFLIDLHDPIYAFIFFVVFASVSVILISQLHSITPSSDPEQQFLVLQILYAFDIFFQNGMFASGIKFIHDHFRPAQYGRSLTVYAIGGRLGSIISILVMGNIVTQDIFWTTGSQIAAYMSLSAILPLFLIKQFPHPAPHLAAQDEQDYHDKLHTHSSHAPPASQVKSGLFVNCSREEHSKNWGHFKEACKRLFSWWQRKSFVVMACTNACMAVVIAPEGFDGIIALFTSKALMIVSGLPSATVTIFYHIGAIFSLLVGGALIDRLSRPSQARAVLLLMFVGCCGATGLIGVTSEGGGMTVPSDALSPAGRTVEFFIGFGFGHPFFVVVQSFALNFGGEHAALVTQSLGLFALAVCAAAMAVFGAVASVSWVSVSIIYFIFALLALLCMCVFDFFEWRAKQKLKITMWEVRLAELINPDLEHATHEERKQAIERMEQQAKPKGARRADSLHQGVNLLWSAFTFVLVFFVIFAFFFSYYWSKNPTF